MHASAVIWRGMAQEMHRVWRGNVGHVILKYSIRKFAVKEMAA